MISVALNTNKIDALKALIKTGFTPSNLSFYIFVYNYPDYGLWKQVAGIFGVEVTCIICAYDFDGISLNFYSEMWADIGFSAFIKGYETYAQYKDPIWKKLAIGLRNEEKLKEAQKKSGLPCPFVQLEKVDFDAH